MALTLTALGTTTFAWFTLSKTSTINNLEASVAAGEGLEIALGVDGVRLTEFKTNLTSSDLAIIKSTIGNLELTAVSTTDLVNFNKLEYNPPEDNNLPGLYKTGALENADYLNIDIFFKSNSPGEVIFTDYHFINHEKEFMPRIKYIKEEGGMVEQVLPFQTEAANAARIAVNDFVVQKPQSLTNTHTGNTGVIYGQYSYLTQLGNNIYWNSISSKLNNDSILDVSILDANTAVNNHSIGILTKEVNTNDYTLTASLKIWIEGFDADAYDSIYGTKLEIDLSFNKKNIE